MKLWTPFLILAIGLLSIFTEFFVPGGIFAILGGSLVLASIFYFTTVTDSLLWNLIFFIFSLLSVYFVCKFALWRIRKGALGGSIYSEDNQEGYSASEWDKSLIGKTGTVLTVLRPGGHVRIGNKSYSAISKSRFVEKGEEVIVVGGEGETIFVMPKT